MQCPGASGVPHVSAFRIAARPSAGGSGTNGTCSERGKNRIRAPVQAAGAKQRGVDHVGPVGGGNMFAISTHAILCCWFDSSTHLVQAAGAQQRGVDHVGPVGGGHHENAGAAVHAVHLCEQLIHHPVARKIKNETYLYCSCDRVARSRRRGRPLWPSLPTAQLFTDKPSTRLRCDGYDGCILGGEAIEGEGFGVGWGGVGGAEDAQAQVSAYHKLFRRNTDLRRSTDDRRQSARRAVNRSADPFLIRSNGRTGKYA